MRSYVITLLSVLALNTSCCGLAQVVIEERQMVKMNPTNYEFNASVSDVQAAIKKAFGYEWLHELSLISNSPSIKGPLYTSLQMRGASLLWKGDGDTLTKEILTKPGNGKDAFLYGGGSCVGLSQVYFKDGKPLVLFADFHIHLTPISASQTSITIFTIAPAVVAGIEPHVAHGPAYIFVEVPPTSIEEFQILTRIGHQLRTDNMPEVNIPLPDSTFIKVQRPRQR